ncbi:glycosyltransferase family 2 protein [Gryllotalpicola protaetiae]|uniref:glycosyltransferase family 2 protein n=1 Tax=Gryllotalpicola protaetiae TaxID=2419771 RepID=UPI0013C3F327|nr:glycosyltransferase [Gryllotalpicola protaetiae]
MSAPDVTVVIPCRDVTGVIERQLRAIGEQATAARFEVVLADNGSSDDLRGFVDRLGLPEVRVVDASDTPGINHARNRGVEGAAGSALVVFCDADDLVHPGWLEAHWQAYLGGAKLQGGALHRVLADGSELGWQTELQDTLRFLPWAPGANCAVATEVFAACGPFDESYRGGGDETDFFWRAQLAGYELVAVPDARIDYLMRIDAKGVYRQNVAYGKSHVKLFAAYQGRGMPRSLDPAIAQRLGRDLAKLLLRGFRRDDSYRVMKDLGFAAGRVIGSIEHRTVYL